MVSEFIPQDYGLEKGNLYEILATTFSKSARSGELEPNTSCMGIKLLENGLIKINAFPNTTTLKNIRETGIITLNFVENVHLYALAALKGSNSSITFPLNNYNYIEIDNPFEDKLEKSTMLIPYVRTSWAFLICIVADEDQVIKRDLLGEINVSEFKLHVISSNTLKESFKLFNRAENLALEAIILATRLRVAKDKNDKSLILTIKEKIDNYTKEIERFGKNQNALKAIQVVSEYINELKD